MTDLQKVFTSYMKIALKYDSIDFFRVYYRNSCLLTSLQDEEVQKVSVSQFCGTGTFCFDDFKLYGIENEKLYLAIEELTERQKEILFLYSDGLTSREIADYLKMSAGTVRATILQIKNKIKKYMEK